MDRCPHRIAHGEGGRFQGLSNPLPLKRFVPQCRSLPLCRILCRIHSPSLPERSSSCSKSNHGAVRTRPARGVGAIHPLKSIVRGDYETRRANLPSSRPVHSTNQPSSSNLPLPRTLDEELSPPRRGYLTTRLISPGPSTPSSKKNPARCPRPLDP